MSLQVDKPLARGPLYDVYAVSGAQPGENLVLQAFVPAWANHPQLERRLRALLALSHPNLVTVVASGAHVGSASRPYLVLDWPGDTSLRDLLDEKRALPVERACVITAALLDALGHAHAAGLVHGDLKPAHVLIEARAYGHLVPRLFGFSLAASEGARFTGSVAYAAPEQILGNQFSPAADLFSMGLVLYEMLAGRSPWAEATSVGERLHAHVELPAPPLSTWLELPAALDHLVLAALSKSPSERPSSARAFAKQLRQILNAPDEPVRRAPAKPRVAPPPRSSTNRAQLLVSSGFLLGAGVLCMLPERLRADAGSHSTTPLTLPDTLVTPVETNSDAEVAPSHANAPAPLPSNTPVER